MKIIGALKLSALIYVLFLHDRKKGEYAEITVTNISGVKAIAEKLPAMTYAEFDALQEPRKKVGV